MKKWNDESGQALVVFATFMGLVALGFLAFALDAGLLFHKKRMAQSAADAVAVAAAGEVAAGDSSNETNLAKAVAKMNGFDTTLATNPATVTLTNPTTGSFTGTGYVQATVSQPIHTYFLGAFNHTFATVPVAATSIAGGGASNTCVCLESASGNDLNMSNGSSISASTCGIIANSSSSQAVAMVGGATLDALTLGTVSTSWDNSSNINNGASISSGTKITMGLSHGCTPAMPPAPTYSSCLSDPGGSGGTITVGPSTAGGTICYTSLSVGANGGKTTLNPGIYVISNGSLHFESGSGGYSNQGGNGVFFYLLQNGSLVIDNGANVNLVAGGNKESTGSTAPSTGAYNGILVYQPASNTNGITVAGGSNVYINGNIDAPGASVTLNNGTSTTVAGSVVASTLTLAGGGILSPAPATAGGSASPHIVQ